MFEDDVEHHLRLPVHRLRHVRLVRIKVVFASESRQQAGLRIRLGVVDGVDDEDQAPGATAGTWLCEGSDDLHGTAAALTYGEL